MMRGNAVKLALLLALPLPAAAGEMRACAELETQAGMDLGQAVERALCNHPQTRQAWANITLQAALTDVQRAAFLPSASGTLEIGRVRGNTVETAGTSRGGSAGFSWTLFDAGLRSANLDQARHLLDAAHATRDAAVQEVIAATAQAYYSVLTARAARDAGVEAEHSARKSLDAADARHRAGAGLLADKLLAQTTHAEAVLQRTRAEGQVEEAHGALAVALGLPPDTTIRLRDTETLSPPDAGFLASMDKLIADAKRNHPALIAVQAELQAARASIDAARAETLPTVALTGALHRNRLAAPDSASSGRSVGIQISIPLFDGAAQAHRVQAARAQAEAKAASLAAAERQVTVDLWKAYQSLRSEADSLRAVDKLLHNANDSFRAAQGRYQAGVGAMAELLNAQSTLANVRQQRVAVLAAWHHARLRLAAALGKLDPLSVRPAHAAPVQTAAPVSPLPETRPVADSTAARRADEAHIRQTVERWAQAWRSRNADAYLAFYAGSFQPQDGMPRQAWEKQRRQRIEGKRRIEVRIDAPQIALEDGEARVTFRQTYVSDRFKDDTVKTLVLVAQGDAWKIREERAEP